jgi:hypothetical protein
MKRNPRDFRDHDGRMGSPSGFCPYRIFSAVPRPRPDSQSDNPRPGAGPTRRAGRWSGAAARAGTSRNRIRLVCVSNTMCGLVISNPTVDRATAATVIREMTPERIYESPDHWLDEGNIPGLSDVQKRRIAEFLSGRPMGVQRPAMPKTCRTSALAIPR